MIKKIIRHVWRDIALFLVNRVFAGTNNRFFDAKRNLLRSIGYHIGSNTKIVGPIFCTGSLTIGRDCWIGTNLTVRGNGTVILGDRIDVGPDVTFLTGTHKIGNASRRAGFGYNCSIIVGDGCWIGAKSTFVNNIVVGKSSVIAACACVCKDISNGVVVGGVPAIILKVLKDEYTDE